MQNIGHSGKDARGTQGARSTEKPELRALRATCEMQNSASDRGAPLRPSDLLDPDLVHPDLAQPGLLQPDLPEDDQVRPELALPDLGLPGCVHSDPGPAARQQKSPALPAAVPKSASESFQDAYAVSVGPISLEQERMMIDHLPTVRFLARRIHERLPQHVEIEDLVSAGVLGLMDALRKFDPEKKVQFRSYAQFRIRGAILDSLRTLDWSPRELRRKGRAVEEAIRALTTRVGRSPSESEVAQEMEMALGEYQQLLGELKGLEIGSLHAERSEDSGEEELAYIPNRPEDDPLFRCLRSEMQARLANGIDQLGERERLVMTLYYYEEMTMKEIGLTLGVVESRVSQIHASAVLHLRSLLGAVRNGAREASDKKDAGSQASAK